MIFVFHLTSCVECEICARHEKRIEIELWVLPGPLPVVCAFCAQDFKTWDPHLCVFISFLTLHIYNYKFKNTYQKFKLGC